jgi:uncharacterized membrane protein YobD (UPF0266 family)
MVQTRSFSKWQQMDHFISSYPFSLSSSAILIMLTILGHDSLFASFLLSIFAALGVYLIIPGMAELLKERGLSGADLGKKDKPKL